MGRTKYHVEGVSDIYVPDPPIPGSKSFTGRNGAGAIAVPDLQVGDVVWGVYHITLASGSYIMNNDENSFEETISVAGQIQQTNAGNLSTLSFLLLIYRK